MRFVYRLLGTVCLLLTCGGGGGIFWGYQELKLGAKSTPNPVDIDLAKLEAEVGKPLDNYHVKIGPHYALYSSAVSSWEQQKYGPKTPELNSRVNYTFYPIVSKSNPDFAQLEPLKKKYGKLSDIPPEELPKPRNFVVLVKTRRFKTFGEIPVNETAEAHTVQGMVVNEISTLATDEKNLIQEDFPNIDFTKVLILEDGRTPTSTGMATMAMIGGAAVLVIGIISLCGVGFFAFVKKSS